MGLLSGGFSHVTNKNTYENTVGHENTYETHPGNNIGNKKPIDAELFKNSQCQRSMHTNDIIVSCFCG